MHTAGNNEACAESSRYVLRAANLATKLEDRFSGNEVKFAKAAQRCRHVVSNTVADMGLRRIPTRTDKRKNDNRWPALRFWAERLALGYPRARRWRYFGRDTEPIGL